MTILKNISIKNLFCVYALCISVDTFAKKKSPESNQVTEDQFENERRNTCLALFKEIQEIAERHPRIPSNLPEYMYSFIERQDKQRYDFLINSVTAMRCYEFHK